MFTKILIPTDGSVLGEMAALEGIRTSAKLGAEVVSIYVAREYQKQGFLSGNTPTQTEYETEAKKNAVKILEPLEKAAKELGVKYTSEIRISNHIARAIVRTAHDHDCSLIFIGSNGCGGWDSILMGSVSSKVLSIADTPVLVYHLRKDEIPDDTPNYYESVFPPA